VTDLIIRFVVLFVGLALAAFVIARMTQGIIRWIILGAVAALAVVAVSMGLRQFVGYIPGIGSRPSANVPTQSTPVPTPGTTTPASSQPATAQPATVPSASPQASPEQDVETGATGLNRLPAFAQSFDTPGNRLTNNAGNGNSRGTGTRPQPSTPSRPIPAGW
jgi:hypothetical protein